MGDIEEKRVYADRTGATQLVVAGAAGVLEVRVAGDRLGRFGLAHRCAPTAIAGAGSRVAVATDEDVLLRRPGANAFEPTGFGPAVAVGFGGAPVAAGPDGRVAELVAGEWVDRGQLEAAVRAVDPPLLAAADGVHRLPGPDYVGLADAHDVAAAGPLVATGQGLYSLGNGWIDVLSGDFRVAAAADAWAHAATPARLYERVDGEWAAVELPSTADRVADVTYGERPYAVTVDGTLLARGADGWRAHALGVDGVVGCAVA